MAKRPLLGLEATTSDSWLAGRLTLIQPAKGHRVGSDAALLAAAVSTASHVADVGAGVGAVGLAIARRLSSSRVDLIDFDPTMAYLACQNAALNGLADRTRVVVADVASPRSRRAAGLKEGEADLVVANPPFFSQRAARVSPEPLRARAHVLAERSDRKPELDAWIRGALALLAPGGRLAMIHRPEALAAILTAFGGRLGAVAVLPVYPRADAPAHRLLILGVKGSRAPLAVRPSLVLHDAAGGFTPFADALHRGETTIDWGGG